MRQEPSVFNRDDMRGHLQEFAELYGRRPIRDNVGGMFSPHMFLFWYALKTLRPRAVIESGVWRGQGTWFMERACPDADIYCIDINWKHLVYRSERATYLSRDFERCDWNSIPKDETVAFFDDHVNAFERTKAAQRLGIRHLLFEDNYPPNGRGDVYSLKMVLMESGYRADRSPRAIVSRLLGHRADRTVQPNSDDARHLREHVIEHYEELPPVFKLQHTRWGDPWDDRVYPTVEPLLTRVEHPYQQLYLDEAKWYTWMCYVRLQSMNRGA